MIFQLPKFPLEIFVIFCQYSLYKPIGFYGLSMVYTMSLFLDVIHVLKIIFI